MLSMNSESAEVIFRGNTIATKSVDVYMKLIGLEYLQKTIAPALSVVVDSNKCLEVIQHWLRELISVG